MRMTYIKPIALLTLVPILLIGMASYSKATETNNSLIIVNEGNSVALSQKQMQSNRGASGIILNSLTSTQKLSATSSGNSLNVGGNLTNGDIVMGNDFGGIGSFVMNTGNNSTINSAVSLNVQILPSSP